MVDMARRVVTPNVTLAGTALWSIQKENQETKTIMVVGIYIVRMKKDSCLGKETLTKYISD